jgi:hypothetical protein
MGDFLCFKLDKMEHNRKKRELASQARQWQYIDNFEKNTNA